MCLAFLVVLAAVRPAFAQTETPFDEKPTGVTVTVVSSTSLKVSWNLVATARSYIVQWKSAGQMYSFAQGQRNITFDTGNAQFKPAHTITGLTTGTAYTMRVIAQDNNDNDGPPSDDVTGTPGNIPPGEPTGLTATANGPTRIDLAWTTPAATGGAAITGYRIESSPSGSAGTWTNLVADTAGTATTYSDTSLTAAGTTRHYRVSAINSVGTGAASATASATTYRPTPFDEKPTGVTVTVVSPTSLKVSWNLVATARSYIVQWKSAGQMYSFAQGQRNITFDTGNAQFKPAHTITGLTTGTAYTMRVIAQDNNDNDGPPSDDVTGTPGNIPPGEPTGLTATANGQTRIDLAWTAPAATGGAAITGYRIESSPSGSAGTWTNLVADTAGTATTYSDTSLTAAGTTRHYRVSAINSVGTGAASATASATSDAATVPGAPTGLTATANGPTRIDLAWTAPAATGGAAITGYRIESSPSGSAGTWTDLVADTAGTATTYSDTSLTAAGTTRHYRVSAINSAGTGAASATASATSDAATVPGAPTGLTATANGPTRIDLAWTAPAATGGAAITGYRVEVSPSGTAGTWTDLVADTAGTATTYSDTSLTAGTTRHYRVSAINSVGTGAASATASATAGTSAPGAPTGLTATANGPTRIDLAWTAPAATGGAAITGYRIEVSPSGTAGTWTDLVADTAGTATTYSDTGLTAGTTRHYRVSAINAAGTGDPSNVASATTATAADITDNAHATQVKRSVQRALAVVARSSLTGALENIGPRFAASVPASGLTLAGQAVPLEGSGVAAAAGTGGCTADGLTRRGFGEPRGLAACGGSRSRGVGAGELFRTSDFSLALRGAEGSGTPAAPLWSVWGRGDLGTFAGRPEPGMRHEGELRTGWLGVDARAGPWVAGLAVSRGRGEATYGFDGRGVSGRGWLETTLTAVWPYARRTFPGGLELWGVLGAGTGEARHRADGDASWERSDLGMFMASLGFRRELPALAGTDLALRGDWGVTRLETEDGPQYIDNLTADIWQARFGLEASRHFTLAGDASLTPFVEAAVRRDGGDGLTGTGVEVAGGLRYAAPGVQLEARGRWLAVHTEAGAEERGVSVAARLGPGAGGRGLSVVMSTRERAGTGGAEALWRGGLPEPAAASGGTIDARVGYGFRVARHGLLTPFAEAGHSDGDGRRVEVGTRFEARRADLGLSLSGERGESADGADNALKLQLEWRF